MHLFDYSGIQRHVYQEKQEDTTTLINGITINCMIHPKHKARKRALKGH